MIFINKITANNQRIYRVSQKNAPSDCCWTHSALAQSPVADTLCAWKSIFWSFLTKTKQDKLLPSGIHAKISPKAPIFGYDFGPIIVLATFCLRHPVYYIKAYGSPILTQNLG